MLDQEGSPCQENEEAGTTYHVTPAPQSVNFLPKVLILLFDLQLQCAFFNHADIDIDSLALLQKDISCPLLQITVYLVSIPAVFCSNI